jgi:hypothetical protein
MEEPEYQAATWRNQNTRLLHGETRILGYYMEDQNTRLLQEGPEYQATMGEGHEIQAVIRRDQNTRLIQERTRIPGSYRELTVHITGCYRERP